MKDFIMNEIKNVVNQIYDEIKNNKTGKVADYIPELSKVNPDFFSISICTTKGEIYNIGDYQEYFCLQSCSKPLSYMIAHNLLGKEQIHKHVGYEPSGQAFNAFILNKNGIPHNPMINAGAIMVCSQIEKKKEPSKRFNTIKSFYSKMGGNKHIGFDNSIFLSEKHHADRNMSLAYYMRENNAFGEDISPNEIQESLDLYYQQCSTTITSETGAVIAATISNGGICPTTNEEVITKQSVMDCITLMYNCGMYDYTGQFSFEVGLPAKSGVSGCILLVVPNLMGICIWSPPLDSQGNSVRGIDFCQKLNEKLDLHIFHNIIKNKIDFNDSLTNHFIKMCSEGNLNDIKHIIQKININCCDYDKRTPLHLAASEGHYNVVKYLIDNNATINKDRWGNTPLDEINNKEGENFEKIKQLLTTYKL